MFSKDIGIDLGTANILIFVKGEGVILNEPSVVAIDSNNKRVLAVGEEANQMLGRTPGKVKAIRPLKDGVIADFEMTEVMINYLLQKIKCKGIFGKPRILICCPTNITQVERNAIKEVAEKMGAKKVFVEEEPKVAAVGAGLDIAKPSGNMIIDIGGGTTDIAVLSLGEIVISDSLRIAGNTFDNDLINYIKEKYKLLIGERTAEEIKKQIGNVMAKNGKETMEIKGRDVVNGLPKTVIVNAQDTEEAFKKSVDEIVRVTKKVLEQTPPELSADIYDNGITLTGGGSLLTNLDKLLTRELKVPIRIASSPLTCVAEGTGVLLDNIHLVDN